MMEHIDTLSITDFRTIKGSITVPLSAPIILIHGPNGAGKTSVLSALELALTGDIVAMRRADGKFCNHLVHQGAQLATVKLSGPDMVEAKDQPGLVHVKNNVIMGEKFLQGGLAQFFAERCYLAQSTLGRLLEIYQHADPQKDSPLTRFVKDLLGLDYLDALIDGLHDATDVRRTKNLVSEFRAADEQRKALKKDSEDAEHTVMQKIAAAALERKEFKALIGSLAEEIRGHDPPVDDLAEVRAILSRGTEESPLLLLAQQRRELLSIQKTWSSLPRDLSATDRSAAEEEERAASNLAETWRDDTGRKLESLLDALRTIFPDLPSWASTNPEVAHKTAIDRISAETKRLESLLERNRAATVRVSELDQDIARAEARIKILDEQISGLVTDADGLGRALAALTPHIHDEDCPVCGRNFAEVSPEPLIGHVQQKIARFTEQAGRLTALATEKSEATSRLAALLRERQNEISRIVPQEEQIKFQASLAKLANSAAALTQTAPAVAVGNENLRRLATAQRRLAEIRNRDRQGTDLRASLAAICSQLRQQELGDAEPLTTALDRLLLHITVEEERLNTLRQDRLRALAACQKLAESEAAAQTAQSNATNLSAKFNRAEKAFNAADARRKQAKVIAETARDARTAIVRRVFNESLNTLWRDLFVRLAPTEPFVPAFKLPESSEVVVAALETRHRTGLSGGAPGAMLSAGNLNTAALTLFLALHLSAEKRFPWLVLDDPIQSMDEVHVAQFAALLRTLSKSHGRKIVIAVHDKPLFDYLTLELCPAFPNDQLITIQLSRSADSVAIAEPRFWVFQKDEAIAA